MDMLEVIVEMFYIKWCLGLMGGVIIVNLVFEVYSMDVVYFDQVIEQVL